MNLICGTLRAESTNVDPTDIDPTERYAFASFNNVLAMTTRWI